jgi:hypothetical protein
VQLLARDRPGWGLLALDYGAQPARAGRGTEERPPGRGRQCARAFVSAGAGRPLVALDGSCFHFGSAAYVISRAGAEALLEHALPMREAVDEAIFSAQAAGRLDGFALVPHVARRPEWLSNVTQIAGSDRFLKWKQDVGMFWVTYEPEDQPTCAKTHCTLSFNTSARYASGVTMQV